MISLQDHAENVILRARSFFAAREPGHYLANVSVPAEAPPIPPLYEFDLPRQLGKWLDYKLEAARPGWAAKAGIDDDALPSICPSFGIAEHSAWMGMEVRLQEATCLPIPVIHSEVDLDRLQPDEGTAWFQIVKHGYAHLAGRREEGRHGRFFLSVRGTVSPMDLANALRGDELFADFALQPEFAHRLLDFCTQALRWYYPRLISWADPLDGGHVFTYSGGWMEAPSFGHLSNDAALLCSPRVYAVFGFPYEQQLFEGYPRAFFHVHNEKLHPLPQLVQHPSLALLEITDDPQAPPVIEDLPRILAATGSANLLIHTGSRALRGHIGELAGRNVIFHVACEDRQDAEDIVALVRGRSKAL